MARQGLDFGKLIGSSLLVIGIGLLLVVLSAILNIVSIMVSADALGDTIGLVNTIFAILLYPIFFLLFLWSGMRAVGNKYGFDVVGAGISTAISYMVVAGTQVVLDVVITALVVSKLITGAGFGSTESIIMASLFGDLVGFKGAGLSAICGVGMIALGMFVNFVVGGFGGLIALRKSS